MTNDERIRGVEDAVVHLSNILEQNNPYARDVNPIIMSEGAQIHQWIEAVRAHRLS